MRRVSSLAHMFDHGLSHLLHEELHWLDVPERIHYKLGVTVHRCLQYKAVECGVLGRLLYTSLRHSQPTSFMVSHSTSPDRTTLPAQHFRSSGLLYRWSDGLELATGKSRDPALTSNSFRQSLKTNLFRRYYLAHTAQ